MQGISPIQPFFRKSVSKTSANSVVCEIIPYAGTQGAGNLFAHAGNYLTYSSGSREFGAKRFSNPSTQLRQNAEHGRCSIVGWPGHQNAPAGNAFRNRRRGILFLENEIMLSCLRVLSTSQRGLAVRAGLFGPMERQKIWKEKFLVWILLQVIEIPQNRQRNFGKAWRNQAEIWKCLEKSLELVMAGTNPSHDRKPHGNQNSACFLSNDRAVTVGVHRGASAGSTVASGGAARRPRSATTA